jgi:hypothetical protein
MLQPGCGMETAGALLAQSVHSHARSARRAQTDAPRGEQGVFASSQEMDGSAQCSGQGQSAYDSRRRTQPRTPLNHLRFFSSRRQRANTPPPRHTAAEQAKQVKMQGRIMGGRARPATLAPHIWSNKQSHKLQRQSVCVTTSPKALAVSQLRSKGNMQIAAAVFIQFCGPRGATAGAAQRRVHKRHNSTYNQTDGHSGAFFHLGGRCCCDGE